jgi:L-aminopeptidase/D-esterase-like protein
LVVTALVVANCYGDVLGEGESPGDLPAGAFQLGSEEALQQSTTLGLVVTNAKLSKLECFLVAQSAHDGLARAVDPVHTLADGDAFVAASIGSVEAPVDLVRNLAARAVARALRQAVLA